MSNKPTRRHFALICFGGALLVGALFWVVDAVLDYVFFHRNLRFLLLEGPQDIWESLFTRMTLDDLVDRIVFTATSLVMGALTFSFLSRQEKARRALTENEESLSTIFRTVPTGIGIFRNRVLETVNDQFCEIFGYGRNELLGQGTRKLYASEEEFQRCGKEIYGPLEERGLSSVECRMARKDGREIHVLIHSSPLPSGNVDPAIISSVLDITEQREQQALYRLIFESAHDALFLMDGPIITDCNTSALKMFGVEREQLVGSTPMDHSPERQPDGEASDQAAHRYIEAALAGQPQRFEWRHLRGDGTACDAEISLNRIPLGGKQFLLVTLRDITERKQTQEALRKSEESLSSIFRAIPTGIGVFEDRRFVTVNERFCEILGYEAGDLVGQSTRLIYLSEEDYTRYGKEIYSQIQEQGRCSVEIPIVRKDGSEIFVLFNGSPLSGAGGAQAITASVLDITDRTRALQALKDSEEYLATIFRIAPTGIAVVKDRTFLSVNERFADIFGYTPEELVNQPTRLIYSSDEEYVRYGRQYYEAIERTGTCAVEVNGVRKDGKEAFLLVNASPLFRSGQEGLVTFSILDITELKKTERELRAHRDKLGEMVHERTAELTESNAELQRLIADAESRSDQAAVLNEMGELLQACETEEETYRVACGVCSKLFPDDSGCIGILEEDNWCIRIVDSWGNGHHCTAEFAHNDCWAIRRGKAHAALEPADPLCNHVKEPPEFGTLCVPMHAQGKVLGMTHLRFGPDMKHLGERERLGAADDKRLLLSSMVERYAPSLVNLRLRETLREQSIRDRLTGLFNRRHMEEALRRELARAKRRGTPLGLVMIDVDHFKRFNDTYGHETGDAVLRELGRFLLTSVRTEDIACRFGGEELLLILPDGSLKDSLTRAEDIRRGIENDVAAVHNGTKLKVTASFGVAAFPVHGEDAETLLSAADAALYRAKEGGRNQVIGHT